MRRAILLDAVPASFAVADGDDVITLGAEAEFECGRRGIPHVTLSDVVSEAELAALEPAYWTDQLAWIELLEERLVAGSPTLRGTGLRPLMAAGYPLKLLVDARFVKAFDCDRLTAGRWDRLVHHRRTGDGGLHARLLPAFCEARGIGYEPIESGPQVAGGPAHGGVLHAAGPLAARAREQTRRAADSARRGSPGGLSLLLTSRHYDCADLLRENRRAGGRTLLLDGDEVLDVTRVVARTVCTLTAASDVDREEWRAVAATIRSDEMVTAWPRSWFGGEAADVLLEDLALWIAGFLADVVSRARTFLDLLPGLRLDAIAAPFLIAPPDIAAFAAARAMDEPRPATVVIEHGDTAFEAPSWDFQILAADAFFATNGELAGYFRGRTALYERPTARIEVGSYRWRRTAATGRRSRVRRAGFTLHDGREALAVARDARPILVYLVTATTGDFKYLNNAWFPDAWYVDLQRTIIDTLARHDRFRVVVKLFPGGGNAPNPIGRYVAELGAPNVVGSNTPFRSWLPWADRVLTDFPSTGLYEALVARVPTLSLLWEHHHLRPEAVATLGPAGAMFRTPEDAARIVDAFAAGPRPELPDFHPEGQPILDTLVALRR